MATSRQLYTSFRGLALQTIHYSYLVSSGISYIYSLILLVTWELCRKAYPVLLVTSINLRQHAGPHSNMSHLCVHVIYTAEEQSTHTRIYIYIYIGSKQADKADIHQRPLSHPHTLETLLGQPHKLEERNHTCLTKQRLQPLAFALTCLNVVERNFFILVLPSKTPTNNLTLPVSFLLLLRLLVLKLNILQALYNTIQNHSVFLRKFSSVQRLRTLWKSYVEVTESVSKFGCIITEE